MSRGSRLIGSSGYMHIYSRGVNRQDIYLRRSDYTYFLKTLSDLSQEMGFEIIAYCLMPNHYHLVLHDKAMRFSNIVKRLSISYAMHFNSVYDRTGPLFQGRFGGKPIENTGYLLTVIRYIHKNPEQAGIGTMAGYKWSSYREYIKESDICSVDRVLDLFGGLQGFRDYHAVRDSFSHKELEGSDPGDEEAIRIVCELIQNESPKAIANFAKDIRDGFIRELRERGLGSKQLSRITGLSIYVIRHVHK